MSFSKDFIWGAASAAYQIEGAYNEGGKGMGIWDALSDSHVKHGENGNTACDHYHRYKEDVALMRELGLEAYRFSVSWPRIMPEEHKINQEGVSFYINLVQELISAGITPMCTLFHWNLPMWLHEKGGWLSEEISEYFEEYTRIVVNALSSQVSIWMTMNEASTFTGAGYLDGIHAPFEKCEPGTSQRMDHMCRLTKNVLLSHGKAVEVIRREAMLPPKIGIAMDGILWVPWSENPDEIEKARQMTFREEANQRYVNWWMDPIVKGKMNVQLAKYISGEELEIIHKPIDFMGYNCYKANNYDDENGMNPEVYPGLCRTAMDWPVTPDALYWATRFYSERYQLPLLITENGMANIDFVMSDGKVHDIQRIEYIKWYLKGLKRASEEGYPTMGYLYWSIMDNFEWAEGFDKRFGLIYVDYRTQKRIKKDSALWYAKVIKEKGEVL